MGFSRLFPELDHLDTDAERRTVYDQAFQSLRGRRRFRIFWLLVPVGASVIAALFAVHYRRFSPVIGSLVGSLMGVILGVTFAWLMQVAFRRPLQRLLRLELVERGISVCIECGYDLRGQTTFARCPECGTPFELRKS